MITIRCSGCGGDVVKNTAMGKEFWVCTSCKNEVNPNSPQPLRIEDKPEDNPDAFDPFWGYKPNLAGADPKRSQCTHPVHARVVWSSRRGFACLQCFSTVFDD